MDKQLLYELSLYIEKNRVEDIIIREIGTKYDYIMPMRSLRKDLSQESEVLDKEDNSWLEPFRKKSFTGVDIKRDASSYPLLSEEELEEYINKEKSEETFSTKLLRYIDRSGLRDSEIYKKAGIDRRHFSKIRCDKYYSPKKTTVIALCIALELGLDETLELLQLAGYSLSNSDTGDLVVKFFIERKRYDLIEVNEALEYFGQKMLGVVG